MYMCIYIYIHIYIYMYTYLYVYVLSLRQTCDCAVVVLHCLIFFWNAFVFYLFGARFSGVSVQHVLIVLRTPVLRALPSTGNAVCAFSKPPPAVIRLR